MTVRDIYNAIDAFAPFASQEKWDNSGLLVGSMSSTADKILVTLDISPAAVRKAAESGCQCIVAHHPVIFSPLRALDSESVAYMLAKHDIAAVCCHMPLDCAEGGINDLLAECLRGELDFADETEPLEESGCGRIITFPHSMGITEIAAAAKYALGCETVRFSNDEEERPWIRRLGICSGSGASMLEEIAGRCDCLLTGDVKHDRWYKAQELGMGLIDCGHYHTEVIMVPYVARKLREALPAAEVIEYVEGDPVAYV